MNKYVIWAVIWGVAVIAGNYFETPDSESRSPRRPNIIVQQEGRSLPPALGTDPTMVIAASGRPTDSTGTAFALTDDGLWLTARHVIENCDRIWLVTDLRGKVGAPAQVIRQDRSADIALLRSNLAAPPLPHAYHDLNIGQVGVAFGFPQGRPGNVAARLLGRVRTVEQSSKRGENALVWVEERRFPSFSGTLGGISGGPFLADSGQVVGLNVAENRRRGRLVTSSPNTIRSFLNEASASPPVQSVAKTIDLSDVNRYSNRLRRTKSVIQVFCDVH